LCSLSLSLRLMPIGRNELRPDNHPKGCRPYPGAGQFSLYLSTIIYDKDVQRAWTMHTLDAAEFDIAGSRWPRDQGDRVRCPFRQSGDGFGNQPYDLFCTYNTHMQVGNQGQYTSSLVRPTIQNNRPRLSDSHSAAGEHTRAFVQIGDSKWRIISQNRHPSGNPRGREIRWNHESRDAMLLAGGDDGWRKAG